MGGGGVMWGGRGSTRAQGVHNSTGPPKNKQWQPTAVTSQRYLDCNTFPPLHFLCRQPPSFLLLPFALHCLPILPLGNTGYVYFFLVNY